MNYTPIIVSSDNASLDRRLMRHHLLNYHTDKIRITAAFLFACLYGMCVFAQDAIDTVVLSGDQSPGIDSKFLFFDAYGFSLNDNGEIALLAILGGDRKRGIWSGTPGDITLKAIQGEIAVGTQGAFDNTLSDHSPFFQVKINNDGHVAFLGTVPVASTNKWGYWVSKNEGLELIAFQGQPAPGTNGTLSDMGAFAFNDKSELAFRAYVPETNQYAVWVGSSYDSLVQLALRGGASPLAGYEYFAISNPAINDNGIVLMSSILRDTEGFSYSSVLKLQSSGSREVIDVIKSTEVIDGIRINYSRGASGINNNEVVVSTASTFYPSESKTYYKIIKNYGSGQSEEVFNTEELGIGEDIDTGILYVEINGQGRVAFRLTERDINTGTTEQSLWVEGEEGVNPLVAHLDVAPGTDAFFDNPGLRGYSFNSNGQISFTSELIGSSVDESNDVGIFATDIFGDIQLIVREGDVLDVSSVPGVEDMRTIERLAHRVGYGSGSSSTGLEDGKASPFNNRGEVAFYARFTDGTEGLFISQAVRIPEPTTLALSIFATIAATTRHRSR